MSKPGNPTYDTSKGIIANLGQLHADSETIREYVNKLDTTSATTDINNLRTDLETLEARVQARALRALPVSAGLDALRTSADSRSAYTEGMVDTLNAKIDSLYANLFNARDPAKTNLTPLNDQGAVYAMELVLNVSLPVLSGLDNTVAQALVATTVELGASAADVTLALAFTLVEDLDMALNNTDVTLKMRNRALAAFPPPHTELWETLVATLNIDSSNMKRATINLSGLSIDKFTALKASNWVSISQNANSTGGMDDTGSVTMAQYLINDLAIPATVTFDTSATDAKGEYIQQGELMITAGSTTSVSNEPAAINTITKWATDMFANYGYTNPWAAKPVVTFPVDDNNSDILVGPHNFKITATLPTGVAHDVKTRIYTDNDSVWGLTSTGSNWGIDQNGALENGSPLKASLSLESRSIYAGLEMKDVYDVSQAGAAVTHITSTVV